MALILNIDSAVDTASVCLAKDAEALQMLVNNDQKDHASWMHPAIQTALTAAGLEITDIEAIAVTIGPGSYTGLRVGLSAAKGLCYALKIPLIAINTLKMMANAIKEDGADLFCPMIDARRKEVFTAVYDKELKEIVKPCNLVIDENSFKDLLVVNKIVFSGNGSKKLEAVIRHPNAIFRDKAMTAGDMKVLSENYFQQKLFSDIAYAEPLYLKEFYFPAR